MMLTKNFAKYAATLAAGLAPAASITASAQTAPVINNTASAEWNAGTTRLSTTSNNVSIVVENGGTVPTPSSIDLYQFSSTAGSSLQNLPSTICHGNNGSSPVELRGVFEGLSTSPASIKPASAIRAGEPLVLAVNATSKNVSATAVDQFEAIILTQNGDSERITLVESSANSGRFLGFINTKADPPAPVQSDCVLSVRPDSSLSVALDDAASGNEVGTASVDILIDPFGLTFDSSDGQPVNGTTVTIVDAATGQPAQVFGDDAVSSFPSTIVTGTRITDSGGQAYDFAPGFYRFPFLRPGTYRLVITSPAPYTHPSIATPAELALLTRPDGGQFTITSGSYEGAFTLTDPAPVRIDVPLDRPGGALTLRKTTSTVTAMPGDVVQYRIEVRNPDRIRNSGLITVTDQLPPSVRLRQNSVRYQGTSMNPTISADGSSFSVALPALAGGQSGLLTYLGEVRQDARTGDAINIASASDNRGAVSETADASIRIIRDGISERFTIIGRVTEGGCTLDPRKAKGIANVRVMLEGGTYTTTDIDGRYHFEGIIPGIHVVQVDPTSFPLDMEPVDCAQNTRSAGSNISRFVEGRGGSLKRADFRAKQVAPRAPLAAAAKPLPPVMTDQEASGSTRDWLVGQEPGVGFLFPEPDSNPRVKAIRIAIKYRAGQKVELSVNGERVSGLNYDGLVKNADGSVNVAVWRGVSIGDGNNIITAKVMNADGTVAETLTRNVYFALPPMQAQFIKEQSVLVADGVTRPRIAVRLTDRNGKPIQHGSNGAFGVTDPYRPAIDVDAQQASQLSGLERAAPVWQVKGENGIAYLELEPTTASGTLAIEFKFQDGKVQRTQRVETWLDPGNRPWTVVGFAAGTIGFNKLEEGLEEQVGDDDQLNVDGRIALYAKGRVSGKWLMTMAYDTDKKEDETRFAGTIDPRRYYTIYADRTDQRYDAASVRRLYLKLERPQFYALFGDYTTGIDEPVLARYQRSFNGIKAEYRNDQLQVQAFGSDTPYRYRRDEIQGNGLSGPYALNSRDIISNTERVTIETRDRLQSNIIIEQKVLMRHIDYDIDYLAGTIRFREPILSRDSALNPQFIIAEYEVDGIGKRVLNAGGRVRWTSKDEKLQVAATGIHDESDVRKSDLLGADIRYRPAPGTEIRAEFAGSSGEAKGAATSSAPAGATAWLVEAEHHSSKIDVLAYVREQEAGFGVGQTNATETGTRKFGIDGRYRLTDKLSLALQGYQENYLETDAQRRVITSEVEYIAGATSVRAGLIHANDQLADGTVNKSTLARLAGSQRFFDGKLQLDAQTEFALNDEDESIDFPARHSIGARYAINRDVQLVAGYEIAKGENIDARTARVGFDLAPWAGGRVLATANQQEITEYGPRTFAAYGLSQSFRLSEKWSLNFTLDGNKTLDGVDRNDVVNPLHPVTSGGFLGSNSTLTEDFTAVTAGATYHGDRWSWTGRGEWRDGETTNRYGVTTAILREIGEGRAVGGSFSWFRAKEFGGASTTTSSAEISWAHRPADSQWSLLDKIEYRYDAVRNATAGEAGPIGGVPLEISGDAKSTRIINSLSINYTPIDDDDGAFIERGEYTLFWGTRYVTERYGADDVKGWSNVVGADMRFDLSDVADIGVAGTVRIGTGGKNIAYSGGPVLTVTPFENANLSLGYNIVGFEDRDFEESRYTRGGAFVTFKLKFDQQTLAGF